jgi:hypothetical protein
MSRSVVIAVLFILASTSPTTAQETRAPVDSGARVRVTAPAAANRPIIGQVLNVFRDTLLIAVSPESVREVPFASIRMLEVSRGRQRERGFLRGAAIGLGVSLALESIALIHDNRNPGEGTGMSFIIPVMVMPVLTLGGGLIGVKHSPDRWEAVEISPSPR